mgnify:CR=1 FL=1
MDLSAWLPRNWSDWAAIAQILQFVIVVIALIYAKGQADEASKARKLQVVRELINEIGSEEIRTLRHWVLYDMPAFDALTAEQLWKARKVAVALDRVGYMVKQRLIPEDALFEWQRDEINQLWTKLEPLVEEMQTKRSRPNYCKHFTYLATEWFPRMQQRKW